jgi:hypothetical protein
MARSQKFPVKNFNTMGGEEMCPLFESPSGVDIVPERSERDAVHFGIRRSWAGE